MAHVNVAKVTDFEIKAFQKSGIELKNPSVEETEHVIKHYLSSNNVLHLATCKDNTPRSTPLEYHSEGMDVYVISEGGGKFANLKENNKISYSIASVYKPLEDFFGARGLQVWGTAEVCTRESNPALFEEGLKVIQPEKVLKQLGVTELPKTFNYKLIKIVPEKASYQHLRAGYRYVTWYKD